MDYIRIGDAQSKGEGVFAKHTLSPKDVLYTTDEPALSALSSQQLNQFCYHCYAGSQPEDQWYSIGQYRDAQLKVCAGCRVAYFCGKQCQVLAWKKYHKYECKMFQSLYPRTLPEYVRAVIRFALQHDNGLLPDGLWSTILAASAHVEHLKQLGKGQGDDWTNLLLTAKAAHEYSRTRVDIETILKLLCILKINGLTLSTTYGDATGLLLDPVLLKINHSCDANVFIHRPTYTNSTGWLQRKKPGQHMIQLLPLREIVQGEELTVSYVDFQANVEKRQERLQKGYFFTCACAKCVRDTKAAKVLQERTPDLVRLMKTWQRQVDAQLEALKTPPFTPKVMSTAIKSITEAVENMEKEPAFKFGMDPYPRAIHELKLLHMDDRKSCDRALICALKQHLLVGPQIYSSPLYPTRITNAIYLLQILALLDDTFQTPSHHGPQITTQREEIEKRGLSRESFTYWRLRICVDTRQPLLFQKSAASDLAQCLEMEQITIGIDNQTRFQELLGSQRIKEKGEEEMRKVLGLSRLRWDEAMNSWKKWDS